MDEEDVVKAPVTRLRRRLSVEQSDDGKSSPALGTPTKKRGGRRIAKPELDLIDENVAENNLKKSIKKTVIKEIADTVEEKPVTPSRRSTRIKSNTSIISDTIQNVDSPRAKRAARRTSQVGSDNDMPLTPARQTRRTRKDSTSSLDKQVDAVPVVNKTITEIPEIISEEPENITKTPSIESKSLDNDTKQSPVRKSPRLLGKKSRSSNSSIQSEEKNDVNDNKTDEFNSSGENNRTSEATVESLATNTDIKIENKIEQNNNDKKRLSLTSSNLIKDLDKYPKKTVSHLNKSLSEAQELNKMKHKRHRTKSWTTMNNVPLVKEDFYSDNEKVIKQLKKRNLNGSGDNILNDDEKNNISENNISTIITKKRKSNVTPKLTPNKLQSDEHNLGNIQTNGEITNLFQKSPSSDLKTLVLIEDSDSNSVQMKVQQNSEDHNVSIVDHEVENKSDRLPDYTSNSYKNDDDCIESKNVITNDSCEPMEVDETLPNSLLVDLQQKEMEMQPKLSSNSQEVFDNVEKSPHKFKKNSSVTMSTTQNLEKSDCANKSTLVLSQLKDVSCSDNNVSKSPQSLNNKKLSKSIDTLNVTQENTNVNKKLSISNYLTSTPLQQKANLADKTNSKNSFINNSSKIKPTISPKKDMSLISNGSKHSSLEDSNSEEESSQENSNLLDDEAEDAGENYKSGESQDEEEKQYEKDNEILEKGETLTSSDELSNDSDYEKDSFLVSSDEADNELLSGSGDDLSMSDNELRMSAKSKKKYNDRKLKEQKKASREMFEARHNVTASNSSVNSSITTSKISKITRQRIESSQSEEDIIAPKKKKRIKLNESAIKSDTDDSIIQKRKKIRSLSESCNENLLSEKEITICEEFTNNVNDPLIQIKSEPKTPVIESNISVGFIDTAGMGTPGDKNISSIQSKDPLNNSDSNNEDSSLSSDNENITQNYNDILNELNTKATNRSMNVEKEYKIDSTKINNKSIQNEKVLNTIYSSEKNESLTDNIGVSKQTKQRKNSKQGASETTEKSKVLNGNDFGNISLNLDKKLKKVSKESIIDQLNLTQVKDKSKKGIKEKDKVEKQNEIESSDDSSDYIDLKLLFSEDSTDSRDFNKENKNEDDVEEYIPLKKTEAKTNIRLGEGKIEEDENKSILNASPKKSKKLKTLPTEGTDNDRKEEAMPFFVDTIGTHSDSSSMAEIKNNIDKICSKEDTSSTNESDNDAPPLEISYKQQKKDMNGELNIKTTKSNDNDTDLAEKSNRKTPESKKKKKKNSSQNLSQLDETLDELTAWPKTNIKIKKKSLEFPNVSHLECIFPLDVEEQDSNKSINKTPLRDEKRVKKISKSNISGYEEITASDQADKSIDKSITKAQGSAKEKKILNGSDLNSFQENNSLLKKVNSEKNKKTHLSESEVDLKSGNESRNDKSIINETEDVLANEDDKQNDENTSVTKSKKRKRRSSNKSFEGAFEDETTLQNNTLINDSKNSQKKKRKISQSSVETEITPATEEVEIMEDTSINNKGKEVNLPRLLNMSQVSKNSKKKSKNLIFEKQKEVTSKPKVDKNKKRKNRDDDLETNKTMKVLKKNSLDQIHVPRLPPSLLNQLEDKPRKKITTSTNRCAISTTEFIVEDTKRRKNKPSKYLEDSIYINDNDFENDQKQKKVIKQPKVLPFIPTATTSSSGYTTNFKVNVIPQEIKFVAQSNNLSSFKNDYLYNKKIKRLGTYELYKRNRNIKMSKF